MTITAIPTRTVGSLGPTKANRRAVVDPYKQSDAAEWNLAADALIHLVTQVGIESSPAWDSLQGIITSGDTFCLWEPFIRTAAVEDVWQSLIAAPTWITTARAGVKFQNDNSEDLATQGFYFNRGQTPYLRCRLSTDGNPDVFDVKFINGAGTEGWGVVVETTGTKIRGYHRDAGVNTYTDVATWTVSTEFVLEMWVASNTLYVSKNGATAVSCGTVPTTDMMVQFLSSAVGAAGKFMTLRNLLILANWSA
jgi:hypothetical protein